MWNDCELTKCPLEYFSLFPADGIWLSMNDFGLVHGKLTERDPENAIILICRMV